MGNNDNYYEKCKKLGFHIKNIRESKSITLNQLSIITGIRKEYLEKIENGKANSINIRRHLFKIADGLQIKMRELMNFE